MIFLKAFESIVSRDDSHQESLSPNEANLPSSYCHGFRRTGTVRIAHPTIVESSFPGSHLRETAQPASGGGEAAFLACASPRTALAPARRPRIWEQSPGCKFLRFSPSFTAPYWAS